MKFKKTILLTTIAVLSTSIASYANPSVKNVNVVYNNIKVVVDNIPVTIDKNSQPLILNNKVYLPISIVSKSIGKDVQWDSKTSTVYIGTKHTQIKSNSIIKKHRLNSNVNISYNNIKLVVDNVQVTIDKNSQPFILNNKVYLPISVVSKAIGKNAQWDSKTNTVYLGENKINMGNIAIKPSYYLKDLNKHGVYIGSYSLNLKNDTLPNRYLFSLDTEQYRLRGDGSGLSIDDITDNAFANGVYETTYVGYINVNPIDNSFTGYYEDLYFNYIDSNSDNLYDDFFQNIDYNCNQNMTGKFNSDGTITLNMDSLRYGSRTLNPK